MLESTMLQPHLLKVSAEGSLLLPVEQLQPLGLKPGDRLAVSLLPDGTIYLHKTMPFTPASHQLLRQQIQAAFIPKGYDSREKVVQLLREVRQEMAAEQ